MTKHKSVAKWKSGGAQTPPRHSDRLFIPSILFQPWFLPHRVSYKLHGLVPPIFWNKMIRSVKRRRPKPGQRLDLELFRQEKLAGKLLERFSRRRPGGPKARRTEPERFNPVYEALSARFQ